MFKIKDGRSYFYQWDINREIIVEDSNISEVHFCNRADNCSLVVEVKDGIANVPNIILQNSFDVRVFGFDGQMTLYDEVFKVKARTRPADYVYTETELVRYEDISKRMNALEENLESTVVEEVNKYIEENPVEVDLSNYYTKEEVDTAIANIDIPDGSDPFANPTVDYLISGMEFVDEPRYSYGFHKVNKDGTLETLIPQSTSIKVRDDFEFRNLFFTTIFGLDNTNLKGKRGRFGFESNWYVYANRTGSNLGDYFVNNIPDYGQLVAGGQNTQALIIEVQGLLLIATLYLKDGRAYTIKVNDTNSTGWQAPEGGLSESQVQEIVNNAGHSKYLNFSSLANPSDEDFENIKTLIRNEENINSYLFTVDSEHRVLRVRRIDYYSFLFVYGVFNGSTDTNIYGYQIQPYNKTSTLLTSYSLGSGGGGLSQEEVQQMINDAINNITNAEGGAY